MSRQRVVVVAGAVATAMLATGALVMALAVSLSSGSPSSGGDRAAGPDSCSDVVVLGARGSGEAWDDGSPPGFGREAGGVARMLLDAAGARGLRMTSAGVAYPALPEPEGRADPAAFAASIEAGSADLLAQVQQLRRRCPETRTVLVGSSQGAAVVHRALGVLGRSEGSGAPLLAVLLGDPLRDPGDPVPTRSDLDGTASGAGFLATGSDRLPISLTGRVLTVCSADDTVCSAPSQGWATLRTSAAHHTAYVRADLPQAVVGWLVQRLG